MDFYFRRYVAPEYASTGMLNERSDVYSFGILIMEVITGRNPVEYSRPAEEVRFISFTIVICQPNLHVIDCLLRLILESDN